VVRVRQNTLLPQSLSERRPHYHDDDDEQENRMGSIGRVSANLTDYCALKQLFSALGWSGPWISGEARVVENEDRNGPVANGGMGGKKRDNNTKRRREEGDDGGMRVGIDEGNGCLQQQKIETEPGLRKNRQRRRGLELS
jgi:hypothetical protein